MSAKPYTHPTYEERCQIFGYLERKIAISDIALALGRNKSTIYREVKRGTKKTSYSARYANIYY